MDGIAHIDVYSDDSLRIGRTLALPNFCTEFGGSWRERESLISSGSESL